MSMPTWWDERRFGIFIDASLAAVPAWSPIGEEVDWYRSHLGDTVLGDTVLGDTVLGDTVLGDTVLGDTVLGDTVPDGHAHPSPMVEVLAHHRDRWGHIEHFDDFLPLLTYDNFDAESWAQFVAATGAGYTIAVAKHHDGWAWWDAPDTDRTMVQAGPRRNVLADYLAACERNGLVVGTYYSLLDWSGAASLTAHGAAHVAHTQILDLVERYESKLLWVDVPGRSLDVRSEIRSLVAGVSSNNHDVVVSDRYRKFGGDPPDDIIDTPWMLCRGIGQGLGHNRAERPEHQLSGHAIVSLLTEVVAKGGHLLLSVGPGSDGSLAPSQQAPLLDAGIWIRRHQQLLDTSKPWDVWGDADCRYLVVDDDVYAIDVAGTGRLASVNVARHRVDSVDRDGEAVPFRHDSDGVHLDVSQSPRRHRARTMAVDDIAVYRLRLTAVEQPLELFAPPPRQPIELAPLLRNASPGDVVHLGDGHYRGPVRVPAGVTVRGLGSSRTTIEGRGPSVVVLEHDARLEHLRVIGSTHPTSQRVAADVELLGARSVVLGCRVDGRIVVRSESAIVRASSASGVTAEDADRATISHCQFHGDGHNIGVHLIGGSGHQIDSCEFSKHLCAIRATATTGTIVRSNNAAARWWGIHLAQSEGAHVYGNFIERTMRGIDIDGGTQAVVDGNAVSNGDSGCIVEGGATDCQVSGNRWERCRIGVLVWDASNFHVHHNDAIDLDDAAFAVCP